MKHFKMDDDQEKLFNAWAEKQTKRHYRAKGDAGFSQFQFIFTETNVGTALVVRNVETKEELDLTDYASW